MSAFVGMLALFTTRRYGRVTSTMPNSSATTVPSNGSRCTTRSQFASMAVTVGVEDRLDQFSRSGDFFGV